MKAAKKKVAAQRAAQVRSVDFKSIVIETGIPVPDDAISLGFRQRYPFVELEIGHSFSFPADHRNLKKQIQSVKAAISHHRGIYPHKNFVVREQNGHVRVWRISDFE